MDNRTCRVTRTCTEPPPQKTALPPATASTSCVVKAPLGSKIYHLLLVQGSGTGHTHTQHHTGFSSRSHSHNYSASLSHKRSFTSISEHSRMKRTKVKSRTEPLQTDRPTGRHRSPACYFWPQNKTQHPLHTHPHDNQLSIRKRHTRITMQHIERPALPTHICLQIQPHPLLAALGCSQLSRHALLHLPAVRHDGLQDRDGAGAHGPALLLSSGEPGLEIPLQGQKRVGQAVVAISLLKKHLLPLSLKTKKKRGETLFF